MPANRFLRRMVRWAGHLGLGAILLWVSACRGSTRQEREPAEPLLWEAPDGKHLSRELLDESIRLAGQYLLNAQLTKGYFIYRYNFLEGTRGKDDHPVRQAGTLWTLSLLHRHSPSQDTAAALREGLRFFSSNSVLTEDGRRYIRYPGAARGHTATVALVGLTLVELLRTDLPLSERAQYTRELDQYLRFVRWLRFSDGHFHANYSVRAGVPGGGISPFSDGEALLLMLRAAKYAGHAEFRGLALQSADQMYWEHWVRPLAVDPRHPASKQFYQWGSLAFYELYTSGWGDGARFADRAVDMALSTIEEEEAISGETNTGSVFEGLAVAWELARLTGQREAGEKIGQAIDAGLGRLITWQVGGPRPSPYLRRHPTQDQYAVGGILYRASDPVLQIDVTAHQLNAMILTRRFLYR